MQTLHLARNEPRAALLGHRVDAVAVRMPLRTSQLHITGLYDEPRVLVVPLGHRLAGKESVTLDDIADEPVARVRQSDPAWSAFWRIDPRPGGRPAPDGPMAEAVEDKYELNAAGQAVAIVPAGGHNLRPDLTTVPLHSVEPGHVVLASRADDRNLLVAAFRVCAQRSLTAPADDSSPSSRGMT